MAKSGHKFAHVTTVDLTEALFSLQEQHEILHDLDYGLLTFNEMDPWTNTFTRGRPHYLN